LTKGLKVTKIQTNYNHQQQAHLSHRIFTHFVYQNFKYRAGLSEIVKKKYFISEYQLQVAGFRMAIGKPTRTGSL